MVAKLENANRKSIKLRKSDEYIDEYTVHYEY